MAFVFRTLSGVHKQGNEAAAIGTLKRLRLAEETFRSRGGQGGAKPGYGTLAQLGEADLVDVFVAGGKKQGYAFQCQPGADPSRVYWAVAIPLEPGKSGDRVFYVNQGGVLHYLAADPNVRAPLPDPETGALPPGAMTW